MRQGGWHRKVSTRIRRSLFRTEPGPMQGRSRLWPDSKPMFSIHPFFRRRHSRPLSPACSYQADRQRGCSTPLNLLSEISARTSAPKCFLKQKLLAQLQLDSDVPHIILQGGQDETSIDWRRRRCCGSFRNSCSRAGNYRRPRLLRAVRPRRKLPESGSGQSVRRWRQLPQLAERVRHYVASGGRARCIPLSWRTQIKRLTTQPRPFESASERERRGGNFARLRRHGGTGSPTLPDNGL